MITLEELATNSPDKLVQGFVNETITDSYLLGAMTFDDCLASTGTSDLIYGYKRVKTPMSAAFPLRAVPARGPTGRAASRLSKRRSAHRLA